MAVTETIQELLQGIDDAQYGRDMRQYIHKGIQKCYEEGSAGETDLVARQAIQDMLGNFATVETSSTASRAYEVGENLVYNSVMYKVTTAIAQGGTITPGTNVQETTVSGNLESIAPVRQSLRITGATSLHRGEYIVYNNEMYEVLEDLYTGDTLVVDVNMKKTTVGNELYKRAIAKQYNINNKAITPPVSTATLVETDEIPAGTYLFYAQAEFTTTPNGELFWMGVGKGSQSNSVEGISHVGDYGNGKRRYLHTSGFITLNSADTLCLRISNGTSNTTYSGILQIVKINDVNRQGSFA